MRQAEKLRQIGLGVQLRKAREEAGMTTRVVAANLGLSPSSVNRNELGSRIPKRDEVSALCGLYGVTGEDKEALLERVSQPAQSAAWLATGYVPDQLASLMVLEQEATIITYVEVALMPGLVQTADYARLVFDGLVGEDTDLEKQVTTRLGRQSLLSRPRGPKVVMFIEEGALNRTLGSSRVLRDQLEQLLLLQRRDNISIRVVPFNAPAYPANGGPFSLYELPDRTTYAFLESQLLGVFVTEPTEAKPFVEVCQSLDTRALDEESSSALIKKTAEGLIDE